MKILYTLTLSLLIIIPCSSQSYSNLINLGIDNQNVIQDYSYCNGELVLLMGHICDEIDECFSLHSVDSSNGKIDSTYFDENFIFPGNNRSLLIDNNRIIISSQADDNNLNNIELSRLITFNDSLKTYRHFTDQDTIRYINDGILKHKGDYYLWGEGRNLIIDLPIGHIVKLDSSLTIVKDAWYFNRGSDRSHLNDLQVQPDGNMTFLVKSDGPIGPNTGRTDSLHFIKIDTSGKIINEITIEEGMNINRNFLTLRNGNYVIMNFRETVFGRVQCLDQVTGDVIWDWELPKGKFNEFNRFSIRDYVEMSNGDIVVCGVTQEVLDGIWDDSRFTAIAARLSPEGELIWFRRFLVPNETNPEEKGPYHFDILTRVFERADSTLCFLGESTQFNETPPNMQYAWILALDENDCYRGNCSDTIVIDKRLEDKLRFELGAKWTYERVSYISQRIDFQTYEIIDTLTMDNMPCYVIDNGVTFCTTDNKILVPDDRLDGGYQLIYDFDALSNYSFQCYDRDQSQPLDYEVHIDSIRSESIADGQLYNLYYLDARCDIGPIVYEGIGSSNIEPFPCVDFCNEVADPPLFEMTQLRCFENSTQSYRFVDYACDSIWMMTTVNVEELDIRDHVLYPNPTHDIVYIENPEHNLSYRLTNIHGQVMEQGSYSSSGINLPSEGVYFVTLINDGIERTQRVVRY